jgi:outer membrane autotransporter protein
MTIGDINGAITATAGTNWASGLYSDGNMTTGNINGTITATATDGNFAYGLYSDGDMTIGNINGTITATAGINDATGLYSYGDMTIGDINGAITATAGTNWASGLYSDGNMTTGNINGTITATATDGNFAYGLYSDSGMIVGNIGNNATITATAGINDAIGLYSFGNMTISDINGTISATAGNSDAYGLYSYGNMTIGNINGTITATATTGDRAYGLYADGNLTTGAINGNITATATGGSYAVGLYSSNGSIYTGAISGDINATAGVDHAYGLYSAGGDIKTGDITGKITATALDAGAVGLYATNGSIETGAITGTITATTNYCAYGLWSSGDMNVDSIGGTGTITATAQSLDAIGLYSGGVLTIGEIDGTITADVNGGSTSLGAYGLKAADSINTGAINGTITAINGGSGEGAYGLYADSNITTGAINGTITATAGAKDAYGLYAGNLLTVASIGSDARITATAGTNGAYGLYSDGNVITGTINGTIDATANHYGAYGIYAHDDLTVKGDIGGPDDINVVAGYSGAYGLYSKRGDINVVGAINGTITATAGQNGAYGLYAKHGDIYIGAINGTIDANATTGNNAYGLYSKHGSITTGAISGDITATAGQNNAVALGSGGSSGTLTTGAISGTISAHAGGDYAYGILSYDPMNVTIDGGYVGATVGETGTHVAAIQSGRLSGGSLEVQNADDIVNIAAGSVIDANIDLGMNGTDHDVLTLYGNSWNSTVLNYDINNVEDINITGGVWHVNGNIINNANGTKVYDAGVLKGTGNLGNLFIMDGGTLNPGNSIGTIHVNNLTFSSGSTYQVEIDNSDNADKVDVSGMATLEEGSKISVVVLDDYGRIRTPHEFFATIIDAPAQGEGDPCLIGEFDTPVIGGNLFLKLTADYDYSNGDVILDVDRLSYAYYARTGNERSIGHAFDHIVAHGRDTGDMNTVLSAIENLPDGKAANKAYDQMMPQDVLGLPEVVRNMMNQFSEGVFDHIGSVHNSRQYAMMGDSSNLMASASDSPAATPQVDKWMPYAKGFGTWGTHTGESDISGYNYSTYGMMGGLDKMISDSTLLGFSMGGAATNVDYKQDSTNADISSMLVSLYGSYFQDNWHVGLSLGYSHNWYDAKRSINFDSINREAKSSYQGNAYNIATEFGNNFGGTSMLLEPVVGLGYTAVQQGSYREKGANSLDLRVDSETTDGIYSKLGLRWAKEFRSEQNPDMVFVPKANVFWIHDFADGATFDSEFVNGGSFTTKSMDPVRDSYNLGAGLNVFLSKSTRLFIDYGWQGSSSLDSSTLQAGAQWSF